MKFVEIHHDKETFSEADLTEIGAYKYACDPTTDCLLTSGAVEDGPIRRWRPGDPFPYADIPTDQIRILAWNSQFERLIWWKVMVPRYGWPMLKLEQFVCVAAQARSTAACPSKLEVAAKFLDRRHKKDMKGHQHMLKMCRPATDAQQVEFYRSTDARILVAAGATEEELADAAKRCHHTPANIDRLHDYCDPDVLAEWDIHGVLQPWRQAELEAFWQSERINDEGLVVDLDFAIAASEYAEEEKAYFAARIAEITDNQVTTPRQFQRIKEWALPRMSPAAVKITEFYEQGVKKHTFDADTRANLLAELSADADFMEEDVAEFIEILDAAGKSTISKYQAIARRALIGFTDDLPRVHGLYMFAGAPQSGRYSSVGIQVHNLVRDVPANASSMIQAFKRRDRPAITRAIEVWAQANEKKGRKSSREPIHALGQLVRPTITADPAGGDYDPQFDIAWCDWSSIEAVVLPWLTMDKRADERLELFRRGEDLYLKTASGICGRPITKEDEFERQAFGKVPELSLGYCGGAGAFKAMAKNYGVKLPEKQVIKIVKDWREQNPWAMDFAKGLEVAAMRALRRPGVGFSHGRIEYVFYPYDLDGIGCLYAILPSGRHLPYPNASIDIVTTPYGKDVPQITAMKGSWRPKKDELEWPRVSVWYGLLAENATQAVATGDLLNEALLRAAEWGLRVCGDTHDEIKIYTRDPERDGPLLHKCMLTKPKWPGVDVLPLKAEWGAGFRYKVKFDA